MPARRDTEGSSQGRQQLKPGRPRAPAKPLQLITHRDLALLESRAEPFSRPGWIFEVKYDGYRCLGRKDRALAQIISRQGKDMSRAFPELIAELEQLPDGTAIDGELVILDRFGRPQFDLMRSRASASKPATITRYSKERPAAIFSWDILMHAGKDVRQLPLLKRKLILEEALVSLKRVHFATHVEEEGERMYRQVTSFDLEGIVAKRADSIYKAGRSADWLKIKTPIGLERESKRKEHFR